MPTEDYKVTVLAWGTQHGDAKLTKQIQNKLHGGNVGHAAIKLTFPVDQRGADLIKQYCLDKGQPTIPHEIKTKTETIVTYKKNKQGDILFDEKGVAKTEKKEKKTSYYEVYFSWWPAEDSPFFLNDLDTDKKHERLGVHVPWHPDADPTRIQERRSHGLLSSRMITLGPAMVVNYPKMPASKECTSLAQCRDQDLQEKILHYNKYQKELKEVDRSKLIVNFLTVYEKAWFLNNQYSDQKNFLEKKLEKLKSSNGSSNNVSEETKQQIEQQIEDLFQKERSAEDEKEKISKYFKKRFGKEITEYISYGRKPDAEIDLPLVDHQSLDSDNAFGLELENMLSKMRDISTDNVGFDLYRKNCSATSLTIINAGIRDEDRPWMAKAVGSVTSDFKDQNSWLFRMLTPQSVYNSSLRLEKNIIKHNRSLQGISQPVHSEPMLLTKFYSIVSTIKKLFTHKQKYETGDRNRPQALRFIEPKLPKDAQEFNAACKKELQKILNKSEEYIKEILLSPDKYDDPKEKSDFLSKINALTQKRIRIVAQIHPPGEKASDVLAIVKNIGKNVSDIDFFLTNSNKQANQAWVLKQRKIIDQSNPSS